MINSEQNPVEWALLLQELIDANQHLQQLVDSMSKRSVDEIEFQIQLGHIYEHLNRSWNGRNDVGEMSAQRWTENTKLPNDLNLFKPPNAPS